MLGCLNLLWKMLLLFKGNLQKKIKNFKSKTEERIVTNWPREYKQVLNVKNAYDLSFLYFDGGILDGEHELSYIYGSDFSVFLSCTH